MTIRPFHHNEICRFITKPLEPFDFSKIECKQQKEYEYGQVWMQFGFYYKFYQAGKLIPVYLILDKITIRFVTGLWGSCFVQREDLSSLDNTQHTESKSSRHQQFFTRYKLIRCRS